MGVIQYSALVNMKVSLLLTILLAGLAQGSNSGYGYRSYVYPAYGRISYSYVPAVTHGYGNVHHATPTPYVYDRLAADSPYGEQVASAARYPYSYVPAVVTHGYGNVHHASPTAYVYDRLAADIPYGEQAAKEGSNAVRQSYSYVPSTHSYSNVVSGIATPFMYRRAEPYESYGHRAREGYSRPVYAPAVPHSYGNVVNAVAAPFMYRRDDSYLPQGQQHV